MPPFKQSGNVKPINMDKVANAGAIVKNSPTHPIGRISGGKANG